MGDLSEHFNRSEFSCKCGCGLNTVDADLLDILETIRNHFGRPVVITSGHRCESHNRRVGGGRRSQHLFGRAADIKVHDVAANTVYDYCVEVWPDRYGFGRYSSWVHVDSRDGQARW